MSRLLTSRERRELARQQKRLAPSEPSKLSAWYWLVPCIAAFSIYASTLSFSFVSDDSWIFGVPSLHSWGYFFQLFAHNLPGFPQYYRPLYAVWTLLVYPLAGPNPFLWHLSKLILHVTATYLVFRVCREFLESSFAASCSAVLFAIHPINIESVAWVLQSDSILYAIFFMCSLLSFLLNLRKPRPLLRWSSIAASSAALLVKESVIALAVLFCCVAYVKAPGKIQARLKQAVWAGAPYVAIDLIYLLVRMLVLRNRFFGVGGLPTPSWRETLYSSPKALGFYVGKLLWPTHLSPEYDLHMLSVRTFGMWFSFAVIVLGLAGLTWMAKRYSPLIGIAALLILLPILPVLIGIHFFPYGESVHDRYLYLPSVGFCLIAGFVTENLCRDKEIKPAWVVVGTGILLFNVLLCTSQEGFYRNQDTMALRPVELAPENLRFLKILGGTYFREGKSDLAIQYFKHAYELNPGDDGKGNDSSRWALAEAYYYSGDVTEAQRMLQELLNIGGIPPRVDRSFVEGQLADVDRLSRSMATGRSGQ